MRISADDWVLYALPNDTPEQIRQRLLDAIEEHQRTEELLDQLLAGLPATIAQGPIAVARLCGELAKVSDQGAKPDIPQLIATLEAAGYLANDYVGQTEAIETDKEARARWIIGQTLACLYDPTFGRRLNPLIISLVERLDQV